MRMYIYTTEIVATPVGWKAPGCNHGRHFTPPRYADYKHMMIDHFCYDRLAGKINPLEWDLKKTDRFNLDMEVFIKNDIGDRTNFQKGVEDALQEAGIIWNDKQVIDGRTKVTIDKTKPRIWLELRKL